MQGYGAEHAWILYQLNMFLVGLIQVHNLLPSIMARRQSCNYYHCWKYCCLKVVGFTSHVAHYHIYSCYQINLSILIFMMSITVQEEETSSVLLF